MTAAALAHVLAETPCIVHFTKKDGTARRMLTVPPVDGVVVRAGYVTVFDAEKGALRRVNPATVQSLRPLRASAPAPARPEHAKTAAEHIADIFGD